MIHPSALRSLSSGATVLGVLRIAIVAALLPGAARDASAQATAAGAGEAPTAASLSRTVPASVKVERDLTYARYGEREVKLALRRTLFKYRLHQDQDLFDRAYRYIREYY